MRKSTTPWPRGRHGCTAAHLCSLSRLLRLLVRSSCTRQREDVPGATSGVTDTDHPIGAGAVTGARVAVDIETAVPQSPQKRALTAAPQRGHVVSITSVTSLNSAARLMLGIPHPGDRGSDRRRRGSTDVGTCPNGGA